MYQWGDQVQQHTISSLFLCNKVNPLFFLTVVSVCIGAVLASPTTDKMKSIMLKLFCKPEVFTGIAAIFSKGDYYTIDGK